MEQNVNLGFLGFWFSVEKEKTPGHKVTKWFNRQAISHAAPDGARDMFGCVNSINISPLTGLESLKLIQEGKGPYPHKPTIYDPIQTYV